jgi:chaperonin GroES
MGIRLKPALDKIVIKPEIVEEKTVSGIILTDASKAVPTHGTVIAVGSGKEDEPMELKEGDRVMFAKYTGTEWENNGEIYIFMRQSDVLTVFN